MKESSEKAEFYDRGWGPSLVYKKKKKRDYNRASLSGCLTDKWLAGTIGTDTDGNETLDNGTSKWVFDTIINSI